MHDVNCPYCDAGQDICHDDGHGYEEGTIHHQECRKCGKTFVFTTAISFDYDVGKADCLNGGAHKYERTNTYPPEYAKLRCEVCGDEKPLPKPAAGEVEGE